MDVEDTRVDPSKGRVGQRAAVTGVSAFLLTLHTTRTPKMSLKVPEVSASSSAQRLGDCTAGEKHGWKSREA